MYTRETMSTSGYIQFKHSVPGIDVFYKTDVVSAAMVYHGRKNKPTWHYRFKTQEELMLKIDKAIESQFNDNFTKEKQRIEKKIVAEQHRENVQVGDIFYTSWGYDETHVEFFQVQEKMSKAKVKIQQISSVKISDGYNTANIKPVPLDFIGIAKVCIINAYGSISKADHYGNGAHFTLPDKTHYTSWGR